MFEGKEDCIAEPHISNQSHTDQAVPGWALVQV